MAVRDGIGVGVSVGSCVDVSVGTSVDVIVSELVRDGVAVLDKVSVSEALTATVGLGRGFCPHDEANMQNTNPNPNKATAKRVRIGQGIMLDFMVCCCSVAARFVLRCICGRFSQSTGFWGQNFRKLRRIR